MLHGLLVQHGVKTQLREGEQLLVALHLRFLLGSPLPQLLPVTLLQHVKLSLGLRTHCLHLVLKLRNLCLQSHKPVRLLRHLPVIVLLNLVSCLQVLSFHCLHLPHALSLLGGHCLLQHLVLMVELRNHFMIFLSSFRDETTAFTLQPCCCLSPELLEVGILAVEYLQFFIYPLHLGLAYHNKVIILRYDGSVAASKTNNIQQEDGAIHASGHQGPTVAREAHCCHSASVKVKVLMLTQGRQGSRMKSQRPSGEACE
mmetsp:Transcript_52591/g.125596  ORF Transcript_52591/g.125596 Transcript_52591/m.125596 type:complete len:257 (-) Transcript_52591:1937-2707(-)